MIKRGVYCSRTKTQIEERHGGGVIKDYFYHHLCFYIPDDLVGFYGSSRLWLKPYYDKEFIYKGHLVKVEGQDIEFAIFGPAPQDNWVFTGKVAGDVIYIRAIRVNEPNVVWLEEIFEYIGPMQEDAATEES